jgi:hypothetical protein
MEEPELWGSYTFIKQLANCPSRMTGKSKAVNTHSYKYYPKGVKIPQQHYHGNGYNNT